MTRKSESACIDACLCRSLHVLSRCSIRRSQDKTTGICSQHLIHRPRTAYTACYSFLSLLLPLIPRVSLTYTASTFSLECAFIEIKGRKITVPKVGWHTASTRFKNLRSSSTAAAAKTADDDGCPAPCIQNGTQMSHTNSQTSSVRPVDQTTRRRSSASVVRVTVFCARVLLAAVSSSSWWQRQQQEEAGIGADVQAARSLLLSHTPQRGSCTKLHDTSENCTLISKVVFMFN